MDRRVPYDDAATVWKLARWATPHDVTRSGRLLRDRTPPRDTAPPALTAGERCLAEELRAAERHLAEHRAYARRLEAVVVQMAHALRDPLYARAAR